ncbi:hypothetical protein [Aliarcobacter butzleri]|uniref:hypothetical protein n=1 Tax=Aliarcobacter butzleri TaxID=28197 RepID=UPI001EDC204F|nr:hypothetical protein [Aliarcobacter butzleri]MCG3693438.1 hypothetical protein [Aliarcobacter butzleri]
MNKEKICFKIQLKDKTDKKDYIFKLNYETCDLKESNTNNGTHIYYCDKLKNQEYLYSFGTHNGKIHLDDNKNIYEINIDNYDYVIDSHNLILEKNQLKGILSLKDKKEGIFKYANNQTSVPIKLYNIDIDESKINNGYLKFQKNWNEISKTYYSHKKLYTEYSIENSTYKSSKYYLLSKKLDISDVFSISYNKNDQILDINDYLKINNNLMIYGNSYIPNINLITINAKEESDLNGFIKFNLINVHKDAKINLFFGKNYLFSISSLNYHFPENSKNELSKPVRVEPITQTDKNIKLKNNKFIEKIEISFSKQKNNCQIIVKTDSHRPVTHNTICNTKEFNFEKDKNSVQVINFQLNVESPNTCKKANCFIFEISDISTGI